MLDRNPLGEEPVLPAWAEPVLGCVSRREPVKSGLLELSCGRAVERWTREIFVNARGELREGEISDTTEFNSR